MNFEEVGRRYAALRERYEQGLIAAPEFERAVAELVAVAPDGRRWRLDPYAGIWVELGAADTVPAPARPGAKAPETLLELLAIMARGMVKNIPRMILTGLAMAVLTWVAHTYIIAKVNDGLMYNSARVALNSVVHLRQTYFPGVNAFWGLLAYFVSSFFMRALSLGPRQWFRQIVQSPQNIRQSFLKSTELPPGPMILGAFLALLLIVLYRNFMLSWVLLIGTALVITAHYQSMEITVLRLGLSDVQKLFKRRFVPEGTEYDAVYLAVLGMAGGFFLAALWRARLVVTLIFALLFLAAYVLLKVKGMPKVAALLILAGGAWLLLDNPVFAWCEGGSLSQVGGSWIAWWNSNNADLVRRLGIAPAASSFFGSCLGSAAATITSSVALPSSVVTLQGPEALQRLQQLGLAAQGPDGRWVKTGDWENATAPGSPLSGYVHGSRYGGSELDPDIIITVEPGQAPAVQDPATSFDEPFAPAEPDQWPPDQDYAEPPATPPDQTAPGKRPPDGGDGTDEKGPETVAGGDGVDKQDGAGGQEEGKKPDQDGASDREEGKGPEPPGDGEGDKQEDGKEPDSPGDGEGDAGDKGDEQEGTGEQPPDSRTDLTPEQLTELKSRMEQVIKEKIKEGYFVRNSGAVKKVFWNFPVVGKTVEWAGGWKGGQCGEYGEWGAQWSEKFIREVVGDDAIITTTALERNRFKNHRATKIIMPSGERYVFDYWESMTSKEPKIYTEQEWMEKWKKQLGGNPQVIETSVDEMTLKNYINTYGEEKGIALFRRIQKNSGQAETVIRSYRRAPW